MVASATLSAASAPVNTTLSGRPVAYARQLTAPDRVTTAPASADPPIITRCSGLPNRRRAEVPTVAMIAMIAVEASSVPAVVSAATRLAATVSANSRVATPARTQAARGSRVAAAVQPAAVATAPLHAIGDHQGSCIAA